MDTWQASLADLLDHVPIPLAVSAIGPHITWFDPEARVLFVNRRFTELFGYEAGDVPTVRAWAERAYPDAAYRVAILGWWDGQIERLNRTGESASQESRVTSRAGAVIDVVITAAAVSGCLVIAFRDVTVENLARAALRNSEAQLQEIIDAAPMPLSHRLPGSDRIHVNAAFTDFCGYAAEDVPTIDAWFERAYPDPEYRRHVLAVWQPLVEQARATDGRVPPRQFRVTCKDGTVRDVEISGTLVGETFVVQFLDLTDRLHAERTLREQREQIAHVQRTAVLGQLAAALAHELNQPLGAIQRNAEAAGLLLGRRGDPDLGSLQDIVADVHREILRAGAVLDRIRNLLRRAPTRFEPVGIDALLADVTALVRPVTDTAGVTLSVSQECGLPPLRADRVLVQQLLLNLIVNAADAAARRSGGRITVLVERATAGSVRFSVADNGGGVPRGMERRILEPFVTSKPEGLGMGLPIVATIVDEHGGSLRLDNEPGLGATFHVSLPVAEPSVDGGEGT